MGWSAFEKLFCMQNDNLRVTNKSTSIHRLMGRQAEAYHVQLRDLESFDLVTLDLIFFFFFTKYQF